jgi:hypothetical protein
MSLLQVFLASLGGLALLQFALIPWSKHRLLLDRSLTSIGRAAVLATLGHARGVLLVVTSTTVVLLLIVTLLRFQGGTTIEQLESAVLALQTWRGRFAGFGPFWGGISLVLLVIALGLHAHRSGKRRMVKLFQTIQHREWERLRQERQEGRLEELPPTREMVIAEEEIGRLNARRESLLGFTGTSEGRDQLIHQISYSITMYQGYLEALDIGRRITLQLDPEQAVLPSPRSGWEKLQSLVYSRGLLLSLGAGSRLLHTAGLVLLVPSLLGVCSPAVDRVLDDRASHLGAQLDELSRVQVFKNVQQAKESFDRALAQPAEASRALSAQDDEILRSVSVQFEKTMASARVWGNLTPRFAPAFEFRSMSVRDKILGKYAAKSGLPIQQHPSMSHLADLTPVERQTSEIFDLALQRGPTSSVGRRLYSELRTAALKSPSLVEKLRAGLDHLGSPAGSDELSGALFRRITELVVDPDAGPLGEAVRRNVDVNSLRSEMAQYHEATRQQFVADVVGAEHDLATALNRVKTADGPRSMISRPSLSRFKDNIRAVYTKDLHAVFADKPPAAVGVGRVQSLAAAEPAGDSLMGKLRNHPPSVDEIGPAAVDLEKTTSIIERLDQRLKSVGSVRSTNPFAEPLSVYADEFPAQLAAEAKTPLGKLLARTPKPNLPETSLVRFGLSRNYGMLRGFSRVGGVLIGGSPAKGVGPECDYVDLRWEPEGSRCRLVLVGRDGGVRRSRPYRTSLISQALAYAADGRPVTVTILNSFPLVDQKVLLHPVLLDTPLGARTIALDKYVFDYTGDEPFHKKAREDVQAQMELFTYAWAVRTRALVQSVLRLSDLREEFRRYLEYVDNVARSILEPVDFDGRDIAARVATVLKDPAQIADAGRSPLTVKKEHFDQELVSTILGCTGNGPDVSFAKFDARLRSEVKEAADSLAREIDTDDGDDRPAAVERRKRIVRWLTQLPTFHVMSGVREKVFTTDAADILAVDGPEPPIPFDFTLQIAFSSSGLLEEGQEHRNADDSPWEFPAIKQTIHEKVMERIRNDPSGRDKTVISDVSEFVMLQRLFRLALSGNLGADFPVEKLEELMKFVEPKGSRPNHRTLRWYPRPGVFERAAVARLEALGESLDAPANESIRGYKWYGDLKRALAARGKQLADWLRKWDDFQARLANVRSQPSTASRLWDEWQEWDKSWQQAWATHQDLDSIQEQIGLVKAILGAKDSSDAATQPLVKNLSFAFETAISGIEMRQALGIGQDDRQADLERSAPWPGLD